MNQYDIIGDIHGCAKTLSSMLTTLGYSGSSGVFKHPSRKVIFLGDFIDRAPHQEETINIVRPMIDSGAALAVMGNHELNAIAYYTQNGDSFLREHSEKNRKQHIAFLKAYENSPEKYLDVIEWFKTLPLWIDMPELRVIHACWDKLLIKEIKNELQGNLINDSFLKLACTKGTWQYSAVETLLKGKELTLPNGLHIHDKEGNKRHEIRVRWWDGNVKTFKDAYIGPEEAVTHIPEDDIKGDHLVEYTHEDPPCFLGHYWLGGEPSPLAKNIGCVDYSVGKPEGRLVAYRWNGEKELKDSGFISVPRLEPFNVE